MATFEELSADQIEQVMAEAVRDRTPVSLTVRDQTRRALQLIREMAGE